MALFSTMVKACGSDFGAAVARTGEAPVPAPTTQENGRPVPSAPRPTAEPHTRPTSEPPTSDDPVGGFAALRIPNYRLFASSQVIANSGVWMQRIAQDWLVLSLTGSVTAVGIVTALQFAPVVLFGLLGGVLADRHSKRTLLLITHAAQAVLAGMLTVLTFSGAIQVGHVYAIALALGLVT